jgi:hypothetical protein
MMWNRMRAARPAWSSRTGLFLPALAAIALLGAAATGAFAADPPDDPKTPPADSHQKPPSYSDDDLAKYHKPKPGAADAESKPEASQTASPAPTPAKVPGTAAAPGPAAAPKVPQPMAAKKPASPAARPPAPVPATASRPAAPAAGVAQDPLKPWKDREARTKFREDQLQGLRDRIAALQSRMDYLNLKRLAILDPLRVMPKAQSDDERTADAGKGSRDLLASVDEEIKSAEADLKEAKDDLVTIETRFAQESAQP